MHNKASQSDLRKLSFFFKNLPKNSQFTLADAGGVMGAELIND